MSRRIVLTLVSVLLIGLLGAPSYGGGGGGFSGGRSGGSFSGGSKSSGGSYSGSKSGGSSKTYANGASKPSRPTAGKPSTGSRPQPTSTPKLIPPAPVRTSVPPRVGTPVGRSYARDRTFLIGHPAYVNPYGGAYFGYYNSPYYYLWLASIMDNDHQGDPLPPSKDGQVDQALPSYLGVVKAEYELYAKKVKPKAAK